MLALADMKEMNEAEVKSHIAADYRTEEGGYPYQDAIDALTKNLEPYTVLVAYESVGSWGCDSSSFFLLERDGKLYENHGSHCSCYGFEGQWEPEETSKESLMKRSYWSMGGYDSDSEQNTKAIREFVESLPE